MIAPFSINKTPLDKNGAAKTAPFNFLIF